LIKLEGLFFNGSEFSELRNYVSNVLGIPAESFVLKYFDNEGDRITMTSNEDLSLALSFSDKLLRLVVDISQAVPQQPPQFPISTFPGISPPYQQPFPQQSFPQQSFPPQSFPQQSPQQFSQQQVPSQSPQPYSGYGYRHHHHHGGHHGGRGGGGYYQGCPRDARKAKILSKIEMLKQTLAQMPPEEQSYRKQQIQMKIQHLESKLNRVENWQERKVMKQQQKIEKKWEKRVDPQTLNQIQVLKGQIGTLKDSMSLIKEQKKAKKNELQICLQTGSGDKEAIWRELLTLKESGHEVGKQIGALKDQIRALRGF